MLRSPGGNLRINKFTQNGEKNMKVAREAWEDVKEVLKGLRGEYGGVREARECV